MPAQKDETAWIPVEGDHADDTTYQRQHLNPLDPPTDERRTSDEVGEADED